MEVVKFKGVPVWNKCVNIHESLVCPRIPPAAGVFYIRARSMSQIAWNWDFLTLGAISLACYTSIPSGE